MTSYATFEDALASATGQKNLLTGNGLSIAFDSSFGYARLFDAADFEVRNPSIAGVFSALGTHDFESVAGALVTTRDIARRFSQDSFADSLEVTLENLKGDLITAVRDTHPESRAAVSDAQCMNLQSFFAPFFDDDGCIFSLNYDALAYWAVLRNTQASPVRGRFADGFGDPAEGNVRFLGDGCARPVNLLFPHGCLFIFEEDGNVYKPQAVVRETPLLEIINSNMEQGKFPLFVSEGTSAQKLKAIRKNHYLNYAFDKLGAARDNFFIYGHSLDRSSDGHILDMIAKNDEINHIYASFYQDEDEVLGRLHLLRSEAGRPSLNIHTFPSYSATCW